jgi:hypothetical protein
MFVLRVTSSLLVTHIAHSIRSNLDELLAGSRSPNEPDRVRGCRAGREKSGKVNTEDNPRALGGDPRVRGADRNQHTIWIRKFRKRRSTRIVIRQTSNRLLDDVDNCSAPLESINFRSSLARSVASRPLSRNPGQHEAQMHGMCVCEVRSWACSASRIGVDCGTDGDCPCIRHSCSRGTGPSSRRSCRQRREESSSARLHQEEPPLSGSAKC